MRRTIRRAGAALLLAGLALFVAAGSATAGSGGHQVFSVGGDNNKGDVFVSNSNESPPGNQTEPHLSCSTIYIWADKNADSSGDYTIDSIPASGHGGQVWSGSWNYTGSGNKVISSVDAQALVDEAVSSDNATKQAQQGFHFKLNIFQDPIKHKNFWVNCDPSTPEGSPTASPSETPSETPTATPTETPTGTPTGSAQALTSSPTSTPTGGTKAIVNTPSTGAGPDTVGPLAFLGLLMMIGGAVLVAIGRRRDTANS